MRLQNAAFAALTLSLTLAASQAIAADPGARPAPTAGAATCISGFTATPTSWSAKGPTSYVCKSEKPACANGTQVEGNTKAISGPLINEPGQQNMGMSKSGYFFYTCAVPSAPVHTT